MTYLIRIEKVSFLVDMFIWTLSESFVKYSRNRRRPPVKGRHCEYHYPTYRPIPGHFQLIESLAHLGQRNTKNASSTYGEDCWIFLLSSFSQRLFFPFPVWTSPLKKKKKFTIFVPTHSESLQMSRGEGIVNTLQIEGDYCKWQVT